MKAGACYMILLTCIANVVGAQSLINSTSIFIPGSVTIHANNVENNGFIRNNGTIETTGNWKNKNVYQGQGTTAFTGNNQSIDNNGQDIHHLLISGGSSKSVT